jgi:hypothetical protein
MSNSLNSVVQPEQCQLTGWWSQVGRLAMAVLPVEKQWPDSELEGLGFLV